MAFRVLITARSFSKAAGAHLDLLAQNDCETIILSPAHPLTASELGAIIGGYDAVILGLDICDAHVIEQADRLRVISRYGVGVDAVDLAAAGRRGIPVTNTPGANAIAVAELTIGFFFALARGLPATTMAARQNVWLRPSGFELTGKTLGIIGFGAIGREVASRARALGMTVLAYDPYWQSKTQDVQIVPLNDLLTQSHIVSLHAAANPDSQSLINRDRIALMRDGAYLVNTARGALVDEDALYEALTSGKLAGAALDVLVEDPPTDHRLLALENCLYTPHIGATTGESAGRMAWMAAQNCVDVFTGAPCPYIVNAALLVPMQTEKVD